MQTAFEKDAKKMGKLEPSAVVCYERVRQQVLQHHVVSKDS